MTALVVPFPMKLSAEQAMSKIRKAGRLTDLIGWSDHAVEKMSDQMKLL